MIQRVERAPPIGRRDDGLMPRPKREALPFHDVLRALHHATGRWEASFASKLVATFDPSKPMIDAVVLTNVGLRLPVGPESTGGLNDPWKNRAGATPPTSRTTPDVTSPARSPIADSANCCTS